MADAAYFRFFGSLNDFLNSDRKNRLTAYDFAGAPAIKDAIEAQGVPHPEVDVILVNNTPVDFSYPLHPREQVKVYPADTVINWPEGYSFRAKHPPPDRFVLDVHLGKLARALRMFGFDTCYENNYSDKTIAHIAETEKRIVLTRDIGLLKQKTIRWGYWLRSQHLQEQLAEIMHHYHLGQKLKPFTRCIACNGAITEVQTEQVLDRLPPNTKQYFHQFYQCFCCKRVYWKGSHYDRMQQFIQQNAKLL